MAADARPTPGPTGRASGPPAPERRPRPARGPRGRPDRRLVLAAGQGRPGRHRAPGGRERLHRGGHGRHRRLRQALFEEMVARIEETDLSVPVRKGPWLYYRRTVEGSSYGIHCRRPAPATGGTAAGTRRGPSRASRCCWTRTPWPRAHDDFAVGNLDVSPDHRWLAYSTDTTGGERLHHALRRPGRGRASRPRPSPTPPTAWPGPTTMPPSSTCGWTRPCAPSSSGATGWEPTSPPTPWSTRSPTTASTSGVGRTKDDRFILLGLDSKVTSESRAPARRRPRAAVRGHRAAPPGHRVQRRPRPRRPRSAAGRFLIVTNDGAEDFRLMEAPDDARGGRHWREVIPAPARRPAGRRRPLRRPPGGLRARRRRARAPGDRRCLRAPPRPWTEPESPVDGLGRGQPRVRLDLAPLRVHLAR